MSLGICMKAVNSYTFKSKTDFFFEFIPQIILLSVLFGYMNILIIIKWLTNYAGQESMAPSIINTMINIPLKGGAINGNAFIGSAAFNQSLSVILLLIGLVCVPIMLLPKPFIVNKKNNHLHFDHEKHDKEDIEEIKTELEEQLKSNIEENEKEPRTVSPVRKIQMRPSHNDSHPDHKDVGSYYAKTYPALKSRHKKHEFSEIFIHQLIETIEFVLGTISNTASYL